MIHLTRSEIHSILCNSVEEASDAVRQWEALKYRTEMLPRVNGQVEVKVFSTPAVNVRLAAHANSDGDPGAFIDYTQTGEQRVPNPPPLVPYVANEALILDDRLEARFVNYKAGLRSWAMVFVTNAVQPHLLEVQISRLKRKVVSTPVVSTNRAPARRELLPEYHPDFASDFNERMTEAGRLVTAMQEDLAFQQRNVFAALGLSAESPGTVDINPRPESMRFQVNIDGLQAAGIDVEQLRAPPEEEKVDVVVVAEFSRKVEL